MWRRNSFYKKNKRDVILFIPRLQKELAKNICEYLRPIREKRKYYEEHPEIIDDVLKNGIKKARYKASETMKKVKKAMKIDYFE